MKPRIRLSTLCLFVAAVALTISVFMRNAPHNAELQAVTAWFQVELVDQKLRQLELVARNEELKSQLDQQTDRHNAQIAAKSTAASPVSSVKP
jgi:hypothetical protein